MRSQPALERAAATAVAYRFLAEAFRYPYNARLQSLGELLGAVREGLEELAGKAGEAAARFERLARAVRQARALPPDAVMAEYTGLFISNHPQAPCRPIESVYTEGLLVGEATEDAAAQYLRFGLQANEEQPDHLAAELEFVAWLAARELQAGERRGGKRSLGGSAEENRTPGDYAAARDSFRRRHLANWVPRLARDVEQAATLSLYREAADLLVWMVEGAGS